MLVRKDIQYLTVAARDPRFNRLDIFYRKRIFGSRPRPVIVLLHGGNWSSGDKSDFSNNMSCNLPEYLVRMGCVVAAPNFRLALDPNAPHTNITDMATDIAKALKWLSINVRQYGGQSTGFVLWGYSSGAHLAALVATNGRYLDAYRLSKQDIKGVIAMDVPQYDVPRTFELLRTQNAGIHHEAKRVETLRQLFGRTDYQHRRWSPVHFLDADVKPNSFLLVSAGLHRYKPQTFSYQMSAYFKEQLVEHGVDVRHVHIGHYDHSELISRYPGSEVADAVESYLRHLGLPTPPPPIGCEDRKTQITPVQKNVLR